MEEGTKTTSMLLKPSQIAVLRRLAADLGFVQSRGSGAGRDGSISQLMQAIANGHIKLEPRERLETN